ncbi:hypothetical protein [Brevundimonas sp.]|uniref:hypothetical protein n=1 Tax=Brevundimonas sp. TaxID=1871086 RepID=UPI003F6E50BB
MTKINVIKIVTDHLATLSDHAKDRVSFADLAIFFAIPIGAGIAAFLFKIPLDRDVYNVTITFFGIFVGLLLNVQVAMFAIFQRQWSLPSDPKELQRFKSRSSERRGLLAELNTNLSYLTLFSCVALIEFFCFFTFRNTSEWAVAFSVATLFHFLSTLMMTIKRSYILFSKEYAVT